MKRLSLSILWAIGLFCFCGIADNLTFAAPPISPEFRHYQHAYNYHPFYVVPRGQIVQASGGITYPLSATEIEPNNTEYVVAPHPSTQVAPIRKAPIVRYRSGRYYTTIPAESYTTESYPTESSPILAPILPTQESTHSTRSTQQMPPTPISSPPLLTPPNLITTKTPSKNINENTPPQLDSLNARLAKMQLEKKNLEGTLRSIDKIENAAYKVQTLVDLAEYVSRDKNYKREADHLFELALAATDAFAKKQPVIITFPNSAPAKTTTSPDKDKPLTKPRTIPNLNPPLTETPQKTTPKNNNQIENSPTTADDDNPENYLLNDPLPKKPNKTENVPLQPITAPDLKKNEPAKTDIKGNNSALSEKTADPILTETKPKDTESSTKNNKEKNTIIDSPPDSEAEKLLIEQPKRKKERKSLIRESDSSSELNGGNNTDNKNERNVVIPPIINQITPDGSKIKLNEPVKMTLEEYNKLNQNNKPKTDNKTEEDKKLEDDKNLTELLAPPNPTDEKTKPKKKPTRPLKKPLTTN
ncbi:MAG: hypothetical protein LBT09_12130 [Planctomycetaceae bacterium]|jgi:hypothetical protein|nr:hypothetical protein [Planctomycetaceae bacterium]